MIESDDEKDNEKDQKLIRFVCDKWLSGNGADHAIVRVPRRIVMVMKRNGNSEKEDQINGEQPTRSRGEFISKDFHGCLNHERYNRLRSKARMAATKPKRQAFRASAQ
jgi:hypothetical protein